MTRNGTVTVLGAGASADAGYPTAAGLLDVFKTAVEETSQREVKQHEDILRQLAEQLCQAASRSPGAIFVPAQTRDEPTTAEWFRDKWAEFEAIAARLRPLSVPNLRTDGHPDMPSAVVYGPGLKAFPVLTAYTAPVEGQPPSPAPTPYLETFFAFYDDYMRPIIAAAAGKPSASATEQHRFRELRKLAVEVAFRMFSAHGHSPATYLRRLFELQGPRKEGCAIATLNFDVAVEQVAFASGIELWDGFASNHAATIPCPPEWNEPGWENLRERWDAISENGYDFLGFTNTPENANILVKLHGSLGWYALEEGNGDIGSRDELRHNIVYRHFRVPYEWFWLPDWQDFIDELASGGDRDPVTSTKKGKLTRKAGAVWIRRYLAFARSLKAHPDLMSVDMMATFTNLLDAAQNILVIGYSWGDPYINDLIFDAVARGATLINVSRSARPDNALALWINRFPTTFPTLRRRLFMFGGGVKRVLEEGVVELPNGDSRKLDLVESISQGLPRELSLEQTLKS